MTCLTNELKINKINRSSIFNKWINIKDEFKKFYKYERGLGLESVVKFLGMEIEGRLHSGIGDCHNTSRVIMKMMEHGYDIKSADIHRI